VNSDVTTDGMLPEDLLAEALELLDVSVSIADARLPDLPLVWVNPAFERCTGYPAEQVLGRNCRFLQDGLPPQPELDVLRAALKADQPVSVVLRNRRADGSDFWNSLALTPLHGDDGQVTHFLALQRDVTADVDERHRAAELSQELQGTLVPPKLPDVPGLDVAVSYSPADESPVSGDFYDLYATSSAIGAAATWTAAIGDVAGKGIGAAAYTATVRNLLKGISLNGGSPAQALSLLNSALLDELGDRFVTVALAQLQVRRDAVRATVALGGHPEPVLVRDGSAALVGVPGDLLGVLPEVSATDQAVRLQPGDALLLYTDGITESGPADDQFGQERLLEAAEQDAASATTIVESVLEAVQQHDGRAQDDAALLAVRVEAEG
jgi:PAS domain S-box-containing protein